MAGILKRAPYETTNRNAGTKPCKTEGKPQDLSSTSQKTPETASKAPKGRDEEWNRFLLQPSGGSSPDLELWTPAE
jgi:hypothetical protein